MAERRQHERIRIRAEARLLQNGHEARLMARDLSLGGTFLAAGATNGVDLATGRRVELTLCPHEDAPYHADDCSAIFHTTARIVRTDEAGIGLAFEEVDAENASRLHALVEEYD